MRPTVTAFVLLFFVIDPVTRSKCEEEDDYVRELRQECHDGGKSRGNRLIPCAKYGMLGYVSNLTTSLGAANLTLNYGAVEGLVEIDNGDEEEGLFPQARRRVAAEGDFAKLFKFLQRRIDWFLRKQGVAVALPEGVQVMDGDPGPGAVEARKKKGTKKILILSLLVLFKLFKIKTMLMSVAAGVMFIKKAIILAALFAPWALKSIKKHCRQDHYYVPHHNHMDEYISDHHHHHEYEHEEAEDESGYGGGGGGYWLQHLHPHKWN